MTNITHELLANQTIDADKVKPEISPILNSSKTIHKMSKGTLSLSVLQEQLANQSETVIDKNNMQSLEAMLLSQAQVLQAIFHDTAERITQSALCHHIEGYANLAIKANNACRKTILALHQLKDSLPTTVIQQQNNAVNQQINQLSDSADKN